MKSSIVETMVIGAVACSLLTGSAVAGHAQPRAIDGSETIETTSPDSMIDLDALVIPRGEVVQINQPTDSSLLILRVDGLVLVQGTLQWNGYLCIIGQSITVDNAELNGELLQAGPLGDGTLQFMSTDLLFVGFRHPDVLSFCRRWGAR